MRAQTMPFWTSDFDEKFLRTLRNLEFKDLMADFSEFHNKTCCALTLF
jgi:hypothetical protein